MWPNACCCVLLLLQERAVREGLTFVAPYDDPHTIAGQGTIGDEILRQVRPAQHKQRPAASTPGCDLLDGSATLWPVL